MVGMWIFGVTFGLAEMGLHVGKTIGDLAGPMLFAFLMGSARAFYGKYGERIDLDQFMVGEYICAGYGIESVIGCQIARQPYGDHRKVKFL